MTHTSFLEPAGATASYYQSLVDLARVRPPAVSVAVDGATAVDSEPVDAPEHDPVPPVAVAPVRPVGRRHQGALHGDRDAGPARATQYDELEQVASAAGDEQDGRPRRGARRLPRPGERARVVVPSVAAGPVAVEAEHDLVRRRRPRQGPAARVARTVGCGAVARAYYESAGREVVEEEEREEGQGRRGRELRRLHAGRHGQRQTPMDRPLPGHALNSEVNRVVGTELKSEAIVPAASALNSGRGGPEPTQFWFLPSLVSGS
jgi:hypothetical protein